MLGRSVLAVALVAVAALLSGGCPGSEREPLQLDGRRLTVENQTNEDWTDVRVVVNGYFHAGAPQLPARGRMNVNLDSFVSGYGQKFEFNRMQIRDLRLSAKRPNGEPIEIVKEFRGNALEDALGGK